MKAREMERKGMELSMNVIIIAVIALLVLVIVVYLVANQIGIFDEGKACVELTGRCQPNCGEGRIPLLDDQNNDPCPGVDVCCPLVPNA